MQMQMKLVTRLAPLALIAASLFAACADSTSPGAQSGAGTVVVKLTDAPFPTAEVQSVDVFVVRVDARSASTDETEANQNVDNASSGGWTTLATPNAKINLLSLQNGTTATLGQTSLDAGTYSGLRLIIDPAQSSITLKNGTTLTGAKGIVWPSASRSGIKVQLSKALEVVGGATTTLLVDFDVAESFVMRGNNIEQNGLLFRPVVKATVIDAATVNATVRLANATSTALNFLQGGTALTGGSNIAFGASSSCSSVNAATPALTITQAGSTAALPGFAPTLTAGTSYTVVAYPGATAGTVQFTTLSNTFTPAAGQAGLRVFNAGTAAYDVIVTPTGGTAATIANTLIGTNSASIGVPAGATQLVIAAPGTTTSLLTLSAQSLVANQNATLVIAPPAAGATTPQAFLVPGC